MICKLNPACKSYILGGNTLKTQFNKQFHGDVLDETWELSCHPNGLSVIATGIETGKTLADVLARNPCENAARGRGNKWRHSVFRSTRCGEPLYHMAGRRHR